MQVIITDGLLDSLKMRRQRNHWRPNRQVPDRRGALCGLYCGVRRESLSALHLGYDGMKFLPPPGKISSACSGSQVGVQVVMKPVSPLQISPVFTGRLTLTETAQGANSIAFYSMVGRTGALRRLASVTSPGEAGACHENDLCNTEERAR